MSRFSIYFFPFATLWLLFEIARRGRRIGRHVRLPGRGSMPLPIALVLCLLVAWPEASRQLHRYRERNSAGPDDIRVHDREQLSAAIPDGAHVAARWQQTPIYLLWAPQGRYLNVLDPIFMARPFPEAYRAQERIFRGAEPDIPLTLVADLDSSFVAYSLAGSAGPITRRLEHDPRVIRRHWSLNGLVEVLPGANDSFVLDWRVVSDQGSALTAGASPRSDVEEPRTLPATYPRHPSPLGRAVEGFVDLRRVSDQNCATVTRTEEVPAEREDPAWPRFELSPWGSATMWIDERRVLELGAQDAVIGGGATVTLPAGTLAAGTLAAGNLAAVTLPPQARRGGRVSIRRMTVEVCSARGEPLGFYLRRVTP